MTGNCKAITAHCLNRQLVAGDHNATLFAAITHSIAACLCEFLKIEVLSAAAIETLGAMTIAQFFCGQGQMAAAAAHGAFALDE
jgi:hypothetical protein